MKNFFLRWVITTIAVMAVAHIVTGIHYTGWGALLTASLVLGLVNAIFKPLLMLLSLPLLIFTFGLFTLVINSFLLKLVGHLVQGFHVADWGSAFWGSLIISVVTLFLKAFQNPPHVKIASFRRSPRSSEGRGRTIDI